MDMVSALAVSFSLAADAMAVAVCCGMKCRRFYRKTALLTALMFGFFQMLMFVLGWSIGKVGLRMIEGKESIVSFVLLLLLGLKMLWESRKEPTAPLAVVGTGELLLFSIATSMDALALGTVLPMTVRADTPLSLLWAILLIGGVTFLLSFGGFCFGHRFQHGSARPAAFVGGCLLILLAFKTLLLG